jgi:hypothetical protein
MTRQCAWCGQSLGPCAPFDDPAITHGMCRLCCRRIFPFAQAEVFPGPARTPEAVRVAQPHPTHRGPRRMQMDHFSVSS